MVTCGAATSALGKGEQWHAALGFAWDAEVGAGGTKVVCLTAAAGPYLGGAVVLAALMCLFFLLCSCNAETRVPYEAQVDDNPGTQNP